ncbi:MAG: collagen-binding protein [Saprospiraceae bacterium]|nr:MAG: collagen-binding protein [Saprospiraceae bacterium]
MNRKALFGLTLMFLSCQFLIAQSNPTISGYITDELTGETLIGANISIRELPGKGVAANVYGFYSLTLPVGEYVLVYSYLGYTDLEKKVELKEDIRLNIQLSQGVNLTEVVVKAKEEDKNVQDANMGTVDLQVDQVRKLPALFGEVDILKTIQLLPGVLSAGEGNAGFYVRGGGPDQNLVLLDEAVVYNSGHLLGFFSVFNADAIKNTTLIKGGMPANYGGRLSSVVDIQMKEGNDKTYQVDGGIGLVASRLTVQGPIVKEKSSFIVSARRTYALDLAQPFINETSFAGTNYYFYDLNAKINYRFSDQDRLYLSAYFGRDVLKFRSKAREFFFDLPYGNATATLRWNHLFNDRLFMNLSAIYNDYDFGFGGGQANFTVDVFSGVRDVNGKMDFDWFPHPDHQVKFGGNYSYHKLTPNIANATNGEVNFSNNLKPKYAHESAVYLLDEWRLGYHLSINAGIRASLFTQLGPYTSPLDAVEYQKGEPVTTYWGLEPRLSMRWRLDEQTAIKAGWTLTNQYLHLVSNSTSTLPTDVWVPSSQLIKPQQGIQYALGFFRNFKKNTYETSVEVYYKDLQNQIDYRENYVNNPADDLEQEFVFGKGKAYGLELFVKKAKGKLNGWIGYSLSRTERTFPDINDGETFPSVYDRTHDLSVVFNYQISKKWETGGAFVFGTGNAYTPVKSLYLINQNLVQEYGVRNSARVQDYHRIDLSATFVPNPDTKKRFTSSWTFSVYNGYNRKNPFFIYYDFETNQAAGTAKASAVKVSLFPIIPSVTWNFSWK